MKDLVAAFAVAVVALAAPPAHGHGNETHAEKDHKPNLDLVEKSFGRTGDPAQIDRTIEIEGRDTMRFTPDRIVVKQGETIRFVVRNRGTQLHEAVLGTSADLQRHAELMRKFPAMEHDEPFMVHVAPGGQGEIIWQFTQAGEFRFACLIPGHFEAGMTGSITVEPRAAKVQAQLPADPAVPGASRADDLATGEVRRVDKAQNKITLRHAEIRSVEMPAMTMVFQVRDATLLDAVKAGDKVLFRAIKEADGTLVVTELRPVP